jgi:hypothetical protein
MSITRAERGPPGDVIHGDIALESAEPQVSADWDHRIMRRRAVSHTDAACTIDPLTNANASSQPARRTESSTTRLCPLLYIVPRRRVRHVGIADAIRDQLVERPKHHSMEDRCCGV